MEFGVVPCELITGNRPLFAVGATHDPVAFRRTRGALQGVDDLARVRRAGLNASLSAPLPVVGLLVGVVEDVVAYRQSLAVFLYRPVAGVGAHGVPRIRRPRPWRVSLLRGDRPDPGEGLPQRA